VAVDGKWIEGLQPTMSLADAARTALNARFNALIARWKEARDTTYDPDAIHHLRVASRRATAALDAFGDRLRRRRGRELRVQLRRLRQSAGQVRDRDVFLQQLSIWMKGRDATEQPGLDYLCGIWRHERERFRKKFQLRLSEHEQFSDRTETLTLRGGRKSTLGERAMDAVPELLDEFASAISDGGSKPESLHAVRIAGKRLRYGLELFAVCFAPGQLDAPYALVEELQDVLGDAHDAEVNARRVQRELNTLTECGEEATARHRTGIENWLVQLRAVEAAGPDLFSEWLTRWEAIDKSPAVVAQTHDAGPAN
jgi:CHAD domain-containing protein